MDRGRQISEINAVLVYIENSRPTRITTVEKLSHKKEKKKRTKFLACYFLTFQDNKSIFPGIPRIFKITF